ncbi:hypothetical protein Nepgr_023383 [Nepenthes gracilis]|uniref:Uncharacterized protein n=1 Tax=Nepenthes gracilis TaxID=150966 RepID=A0AAD3XZC7_NEPGR|nr:hypothetical protein Nepgr_023383 [Nepenthes gracilis]
MLGHTEGLKTVGSQMLTDDHLFVLLVKLWYGKPYSGALDEAYDDLMRIPLSFPPFPVGAKTGKGNGDGLRRVVRLGAVMGFPLTANGLLVLDIAINLFKLYHDDN